MRSDADRLRDVLDAIAAIDRYTRTGRGPFDQNELVQVWVVHHLEILGEAAAGLSSGFQKQHPEIPWARITGMRNILIHHYWGIDVDLVWNVVARELPDLKQHVVTWLGDLEE